MSSSSSPLSPAVDVAAATVVVAPVASPVAAPAASLTVKLKSPRSTLPSSADNVHATVQSPAGSACWSGTVSVTPSSPSSAAPIELKGLPSQTTCTSRCSGTSFSNVITIAAGCVVTSEPSAGLVSTIEFCAVAGASSGE